MVAFGMSNIDSEDILFKTGAYSPSKYHSLFCIFLQSLNSSVVNIWCHPNKIIPNLISFLLSIIPVAAVDGWRKFLEKERQYIAKEGLSHQQQLYDGVKDVEEALIKNEHVNTLKLFKILNAAATKLLPYIQNEHARRIHSEIVDDVNKLIADGAANKLGKDDMHDFIRKAYKSISAL